MWDPLTASSALELAENYCSVRCKEDGRGYNTAFGLPAAGLDQAYFEITAHRIRGGFSIGVATKNEKPSLILGQTDASWALDTVSGYSIFDLRKVGHSGTWSPYFAKKLQEGDVIGVLIDCAEHKLCTAT